MQLVDLYEKETGKRAYTLMCHVMAADDAYVRWLEQLVEKYKKKLPRPGATYRIKDPCEQDKPDPNNRAVYQDIDSGKLFIYCCRCGEGACMQEVEVVGKRNTNAITASAESVWQRTR